jgi:hypothetical protein
MFTTVKHCQHWLIIRKKIDNILRCSSDVLNLPLYSLGFSTKNFLLDLTKETMNWLFCFQLYQKSGNIRSKLQNPSLLISKSYRGQETGML